MEVSQSVCESESLVFCSVYNTNKHYGGDISVSTFINTKKFQTKSYDFLSGFALLVSCDTCSVYSAVLLCESEKVSEQKKNIFISSKKFESFKKIF